MTDDDFSQVEVPESFVALFLRSDRRLPVTLRDRIAARYELCEDLASQLHDAALRQQRELGIDTREILSHCHRGLSDAESGLTASEAAWVTRRLVELLGWTDAGAAAQT